MQRYDNWSAEHISSMTMQPRFICESDERVKPEPLCWLGDKTEVLRNLAGVGAVSSIDSAVAQLAHCLC